MALSQEVEGVEEGLLRSADVKRILRRMPGHEEDDEEEEPKEEQDKEDEEAEHDDSV